MAANSSALITHKSLFSHRFVCFSSRPLMGFNSNAPKIPINSSCPPLSLASSTTSAASNGGFIELGRFRQLGIGLFRVSAASGGGGRASGDGNNNSGGGDGGDDGGKDGGSNWSLLSWYLNLLQKYPTWTKACTSSLLTFIGDLICQLVVDQSPSVDVKRTAVFTLLGFVLVGPALHFWYLYLSKLFTSAGGSGTFLRLLLDQFLFAPIFVGVFLSSLVTLEGRPSEVIPKLQQEWFSSVLANWQLWIPFQFLNFQFVPQQFQVLAANFIAVVWNVILSYKAHKEVISK